MITGSLNSPDIRWSDYLAPKFKPYMLDDYKWKTCGSPILSLITGLKPSIIEKCKSKTQKHWWPLAFKKFLFKKGYTVIEVTKRNVTNIHWEWFPLQPEHVVVLNLEMDSTEGSWFLLYDNILYHNKYVEPNFNSLYFLNKPPQNVYIIFHPKWANKKNKISSLSFKSYGWKSTKNIY